MVVRVAGALLSGLMCLYWWAVAASRWPTGGFGFRLLLVAGMTASIATALVIVRRPDPRSAQGPRAGALAVAFFAFGGPFLLNAWVRGGDWQRYVWIIQRTFPCDTMGGGPGTLWVFGTSWLFALGAFAVALGDRPAAPPWRAGLTGGSALLVLLAMLMFPAPEVFAAILGC